MPTLCSSQRLGCATCTESEQYSKSSFVPLDNLQGCSGRKQIPSTRSPIQPAMTTHGDDGLLASLHANVAAFARGGDQTAGEDATEHVRVPAPEPPSPAWTGAEVRRPDVSLRFDKALQRNASFDAIPPALPDSPLAMKVDAKFTVIPIAKAASASDQEPAEATTPGGRSVSQMVARFARDPVGEYSPPSLPRADTPPRGPVKLDKTASAETVPVPPPLPPSAARPSIALPWTAEMGDPAQFRARRGVFEGSAKAPVAHGGQNNAGFAPPSAAQLALMRKALVKPTERTPPRVTVAGTRGNGLVKGLSSPRPPFTERAEESSFESQPSATSSFAEFKARFHRV